MNLSLTLAIPLTALILTAGGLTIKFINLKNPKMPYVCRNNFKKMDKAITEIGDMKATVQGLDERFSIFFELYKRNGRNK